MCILFLAKHVFHMLSSKTAIVQSENKNCTMQFKQPLVKKPFEKFLLFLGHFF